MYNAGITNYSPYSFQTKRASFTGKSRRGNLNSFRNSKHGHLTCAQKKSLFKKLAMLMSGIVVWGLLAKGGVVKGSVIKNIGLDQLIPETKIAEKCEEFKFDKIKLEGFTDYFEAEPIAESTDKSVKKQVADKVNKLIAPDASAEIEALKNQSYLDKNKRLYKLYKNNEYNPQLKDYLLSCRMNYINENFKPEWAKIVNDNCGKYKLTTQKDKLTIVSQILQESALDPGAESHVGAWGLGQIMPSTAASLNDLFYKSSDSLISLDHKLDIKKVPDNIEACIITNADNFRRYQACEDKYKTSLAAYNAGTGPVNAYLKGISIKTDKSIINPNKKKTAHGIPPFEETQLYVKYIEDTRNYIQEHLDNLNPTLKACLELK